MRRKILDERGLNFITLTIVDWIDLFTRPIYAEIFLDSIRYCQNHKDLLVHAYVIMPSHVHLIVSQTGNTKLSDIITSIKSYTAKKFLNYIEDTKNVESRRRWLLNIFLFNAKKNKRDSVYQIWKYGNHPVALFSPRAIRRNVQYIHLNPVVSGLVDEPHFYRYSSACDYEGERGLLDIFMLDISESNEIGYVYTGM